MLRKEYCGKFVSSLIRYNMPQYMLQIIGLFYSGNIKDPSDLLQFLTRNEENIPTCGICLKFSNKTTTCVRNHIEAIHFPNHFVYSCPHCNNEFNS